MANTRVSNKWVAAKFTYTPPGGGSAVVTTILDVTACQVTDNNAVNQFKGDGHIYPSIQTNEGGDKQITITTGDIAAISSIPPDVYGTFYIVLVKAYDPTKGIIHILPNCMKLDSPYGGNQRDFQMGTATFSGFSTDGDTNPLTRSAATLVSGVWTADS